MDVFTWSIPFVAEKVIEMFYHIIRPEEEDGDDDVDDKGPVPTEVKNIINKTQETGGEENKTASKSNVLKNKIKFVSKLLKMQKLLREKSEDIIQIKEKSSEQR